MTKSSHPRKDTTYGIRMRIGILLVVLPTALNDFVNGLLRMICKLRSKLRKIGAALSTHGEGDQCLQMSTRLLPAASWSRLTLRAESAARRPSLREAATPEPIKHKPAGKAGLQIPANRGISYVWRQRASPISPIFASPVLPQANCACGERLPGRTALQPGSRHACLCSCHL